MNSDAPKQNGKTYGNATMHSLLIWLLQRVNIKGVYVFANIFVIPVALLVSPGAWLTYRFYHSKRGWGWWRSVVATYRNHCCFVETVLDKFAMYAGKEFRLNYHGLEEYMRFTRQEGALIQLNAHIGCSEILGYSIPVEKRRNILAYGGEKESVMIRRRASFAKANINMISVGADQSNGAGISDALDRGEMVIAFADRFFNSRKTISSTILGHEVSLARGPISLAVTRGLDVMMVSGMKEADGSYSAYFTHLPYDKALTKQEQRQQLADAYTHEIERLLDIYPYQWFNYFNLWKN